MITAASEGPHLRRRWGDRPSQQVCAAAELPGLSRTFQPGEKLLSAHWTCRRRSAAVPAQASNDPRLLRGLPCLRRRAFSSFRRIESGQAISTFQRTSQFFDFACDLCHATTFFRFPCRSDPRLR